MPITNQWLEVNFGIAYGSLATVGYRLYENDGSDSVARTTTGVIELTVGSGAYGVVVPNIPDDAVGIEWDTGGGTPVYATEDLEPLRKLFEIDTKIVSTIGSGSPIQLKIEDDIIDLTIMEDDDLIIAVEVD